MTSPNSPAPAIPGFVLAGSYASLALSLALGLVWWGSLASRGVLARSPRQAMPYLIGFLVLQLLAWCLVLTLLLSARRLVPGRVASGVPLATLLLLGSGLYYFTPVIGAPLMMVVVLLAAARLISRRGRRVV